MKNTPRLLKKWTGIIVVICLPLLLLQACVKGDSNKNIQQPVALLSVVDASPDAPALDFYVNSTQVNTSPLNFGVGILYFQALAGTDNAHFYLQGTQTSGASTAITLNANQTYSLFLSNLISKPDLILLNDTIKQPSAGMCSIRFVDVSPDAPAVDFAIRHGSMVAANKTYKGFSSFVQVPAKVSDTLEVRAAGTSTILASLPTVNLQNATVYTVWLQGLANTTTTSQKLALAGIIDGAFY